MIARLLLGTGSVGDVGDSCDYGGGSVVAMVVVVV